MNNPCKPCGGQYNECTIDENGVDTNTGCVVQPDGTTLCPENDPCSPWDLSQSDETCVITDYIEEVINVGGAILNVHKLLGVHEQGSLTDLSGTGASMASSYLGNFPPKNAFDKYVTEWRSAETGADVVGKAFIGYDFGPILLENGRVRYGIETYVKKNISTIKIVQGCNSVNRVTKVRVERSVDGKKWFGVAMVDVADCDGMATLSFNSSVPSRYWRLRPVKFNGGVDDFWSVRALQLIDYEKTAISNIQDKFLLENRDRDYQEEAVTMKCSYMPNDVQSVNNKWGMAFDTDNVYLEVGFRNTVARLGRPFVIGDIVQLPSETQYTPDMKPVLKYLEVHDVGWSINGYTPTWKPTIQKLTCKPAMATQETQDIMGKLTRTMNESGLMDIDDGVNNKKYQDYSSITQNIDAEANTMVPEKGVDYSGVAKLSQDVIDWGDKKGKDMRRHDRNRSVYGLDAMPPNGESFTESDEWPKNPDDGAYHRLTYTYVGKNIPARLYRWSAKKNKWLFLERDTRASIRDAKPLLQEYDNPETSSVTPPSKLSEDYNKKS
ncbi:hypothetical protein Xoosp13_252 [Xanthomonas phage Xoo-sp13]|nr:hypothetical protein Xoosp13_252 [Xanthomonas phage Xoo-sp13]